MVDVALIVIACVVPVVLLLLNVLIMAKYLDMQATAGHYIAKFFTLLGMLLAECTVLLLPLDVGNRSGLVGCGFWNSDCGGLNLVLVWQIAYCIIFGLVVLVFPYMIFYYEADDEGSAAEEAARAVGGSTFMARLCDFRGCGKATVSALIYTAITVVISCIVLVLMYVFLGKTEVPYKLTAVSVTSVAFMPLTTPIQASCAAGACLQPCGTGSCNWVSTNLSIDVTFIIYLAALMSFVGWFIFAIYVGIGFIALPIDCINAFRYRPRPLAFTELQKQRKALRDRASELMKVAYDLGRKNVEFSEQVHSGSERRKNKRANATEMNRYRVLVDLLEGDMEKFQMSDPQYYRQYYNPFVPWAKLLGGIISVVLTVVWVVHIIIYMLFSPPLYPFLNNYFTWFDTWFPLFGTISIAIFALYLLLAVAKGNTKFGTRFFLIKVHPMEAGKTLLNALVFNVALILLAVLPVTQFCTDAFSQYARLSDAQLIFGTQFKYLKFFRYFWQYNVFLFMILAFFIMAAVYFSVCPSDRAHLQRVMDEIKAKNKKTLGNVASAIDRQAGALSKVDVKKAAKA